jgi:hypothetical protein
MAFDPLYPELPESQDDQPLPFNIEAFEGRLDRVEKDHGKEGLNFALSLHIPGAFDEEIIRTMWKEEFRARDTPESIIEYMTKCPMFDETGFNLYESKSNRDAFRNRQEAIQRLQEHERTRIAIMLERISRKYMENPDDEDKRYLGRRNYIAALSILNPASAQKELLQDYNRINDSDEWADIEREKLKEYAISLGLSLE